MNIKELKEIIKDLPDEMDVLVTSGDYVHSLSLVVKDYQVFQSGKYVKDAILLAGEY